MTGIHPVLQRQLALGCFTAIWAIKLSHVLSATSEPGAGLGPGHLGLWLLMDTALLLTLKLCQVPRLHARGIGMTLLLIASAWCVDLGVLGAANAIWSPRNGSSSSVESPLFKTDRGLTTTSLLSAAGLFLKYHPFTQEWKGIPVEDGTADYATSRHASGKEQQSQANLQETLQSKVVVGKIGMFNVTSFNSFLPLVPFDWSCYFIHLCTYAHVHHTHLSQTSSTNPSSRDHTLSTSNHLFKQN